MFVKPTLFVAAFIVASASATVLVDDAAWARPAGYGQFGYGQFGYGRLQNRDYGFVPGDGNIRNLPGYLGDALLVTNGRDALGYPVAEHAYRGNNYGLGALPFNRWGSYPYGAAAVATAGRVVLADQL